MLDQIAHSAELEVPIEEEILRLKRELNAVILAHYYQESEIQDLADVVGDSLELSRKAAETSADVIVFAGVHFMAETAKILNPRKQVLLPDLAAGCSLAEGCPAPLFREFRLQHPNHVAIMYINCSAEVKALSDIICTSSNAEKIIRQIPADTPILFGPDRNLGRYLVKKTGREMLLWQGACIVHETFSERKLLHLQTLYPNARVIAHPECEEAVLNQAEGLYERIRKSGAPKRVQRDVKLLVSMVHDYWHGDYRKIPRQEIKDFDIKAQSGQANRNRHEQQQPKPAARMFH